MDVIVYSIPQVAVVRVGAKEESVEAKGESMFPGDSLVQGGAGGETAGSVGDKSMPGTLVEIRA